MLKRPDQWLLRKPCPTCGRPLRLRDGENKRRKLICAVCDGPDPLHSPKAQGWARGSLRPPQRPQDR
ncbi:hypothetical protein ACQR16_22825 [Bradyrhizobium oligotrophicum]|uniref:hypothetical protein n=1 Tax=Bradyrhizobium oligotrophicum TaxID=44255 RepID=UPI003EB74264